MRRSLDHPITRSSGHWIARSPDPAAGGITRWLDDRGSALVEHAIVLIVLMMFLFGIMDFSRFLYVYHFVSEVAREGTRYAAVRGSSFSTECGTGSSPKTYACYVTAADIQTYVQGLAPMGITSSSVTINTTASYVWPGKVPSGASGTCSTTNGPNGSPDNPGCLVVVTVSYPFKFIMPLLPSRTATYTVSSTSEAIIQQ